MAPSPRGRRGPGLCSPAAVLLPLVACLQLAGVPWGASAQTGDILLCGASDGKDLLGSKPSWNDVSSLLQEANVLNTQFSSKHVIVLSPTVPYDKGGVIAARAFAKLPRKGAMTTKLTKVVVVGHVYGKGGGTGILVGADVCNEKLVDEKASKWLRKNLPTKLGKPTILEASKCKEKINPSLEQALPFLSAIFYEEKKGSLEGNVLPIMVQEQSFPIAAQVGDALSLLVGSDGVYEEERVLFVFGADLSHGLAKEAARAVDKTSLNKIIGSGFGPVASYVKELKKSDKADGDPMKLVTQAPFGYVNVLAAMRLSDKLKMKAQLMNQAVSGDYEGNTQTNANDPVRGYGSVIFSLDTRPVAQQMGSQPGENKFTTTTATTTTVTTTQAIVAPAQPGFNPDPRMGFLSVRSDRKKNATAAAGAFSVHPFI